LEWLPRLEPLLVASDPMGSATRLFLVAAIGPGKRLGRQPNASEPPRRFCVAVRLAVFLRCVVRLLERIPR
jgi:hypothetical protein